jgi:hypothetical protein
LLDEIKILKELRLSFNYPRKEYLKKKAVSSEIFRTHIVKIKSNASDRFDFVFWSGDLNYRVNESKENTLKLMRQGNFNVKYLSTKILTKILLNQDQLTIELKNNQ